MYIKTSNYKPYVKYEKKEINTSQIEKNCTYFYNELCKILQEPFFKKGHKRDGQLKHWERYFKFKYNKDDSEFEVLDIYNVPLEKEKKTRIKPKKYNDDILMICLLAKNCYFKSSMSKLQHHWGFFNNKYANAFQKSTALYNSHYKGDDELEWKREKLLQKQNLILFYFLADCSKALHSIFYNAIKHLQQNFFNIREKIKIFDTYEDGDTIKANKVYNKTRYPNIEEQFQITTTQDTLLNHFGCKTFSDIFKKGVAPAFFRRFKNILKNSYSINYAYLEYEIQANNYSKFYSYKTIYESYKALTNDSHKVLSELTPDEIEDLIVKASLWYNESLEFIEINNLIYSNPQEIIEKIQSSRYCINKKIIDLLRKHNKKAVEKFKINITNSNLDKNPIVNSLKAIYNDIKQEQYVERYEELLNSYVDEYIKLTPDNDNYINIEINDFSILNEIPDLLEKFPIENYEIFNEIKNGSN